MSSDRELLEKAAKAAGFQWNPTVSYEDGSLHGCFLAADAQEAWPWNPLADDGDALRLAVKLDLQVRQVHFAAHAGWPDRFWRTVAHEDDKIAATRRAIVRAAAALGDAT